MNRSVVLAVVLPVSLFGSGCHGGSKPPSGQESAAAHALCEREAQTNEPPGVRGALIGAFPTTINAVNPAIRRAYKNQARAPKLASGPGDEPLAVCYYDVPAEQQQVQPQVERVGIVVDQRLNSLLLYAGRKSEVAVKPIG